MDTPQPTDQIEPPSIEGIVRTDDITRQLYSTDASIYEVPPDFVFFPVTTGDIRAIHAWSAQHDVTIIPRGAGTSLSGQSIGKGAVVDYSRHVNEIRGYDPENDTVTVEPGVVLDTLNDYLEEKNRWFGPDVATSNRATIGGMIGNNSAGAHSIRYGYTAQHVESMTCVLPDGELVEFKPLSTEEANQKAEGEGLEAELYETIPRLVRENADRIEQQYPDLLRNVSGYGLDRFLDKLNEGTVDFTELICGSEGTLGAVVEVTLQTVPVIDEKSLIVINCDSLQQAVHLNQAVVEESPLAVELLDRTLLELASDSLEISRYMDWTTGDPEAVLIVEVGSERNGPSLEDRIGTIEEAISTSDRPVDFSVIRDPEEQKNVWTVRKSGLPLLLGISGDKKPTTFVEDTAVNPDRLSEYVEAFQAIVEKYGTTAAFYGHISVGCLHIRPLINLKTAEGLDEMRNMTREIVELVKEHNGSLSGEHGDGRARSEWLDEFYSPEMTDLFAQIKTTFDPEHRLNPGNVVDPQSMTENLRFGPEYEVDFWDLGQDFSDQGGFAEIIERCNGSGVCRKEDTGTMCPSFMVTRDEIHSTRGRANALRGLISGDLDSESLTDGRMEDVMDLCIGCKACKSECPSEVDMAPLKQEVDHEIHKENGATLREWFFANFAWIGEKVSTFQPVSSWMMAVPGVEALTKKLLGIAPERSLPDFTRHPIDESTPSADQVTDSTVVIYADSFTKYLEPELVHQAREFFEALDRDPIVVDDSCCGRTYLSQGFLDEAKTRARETVRSLLPYVERDCPVVVLEPSCYSALVDDYPRLIPGKDTEKLTAATYQFSDFVSREMADELETRMGNSSEQRTVKVHGHCHQKALLGSGTLLQCLERSNSGDVEYIDSGCCGMAGSFGYEKEHLEWSKKMGERVLLPSVREADDADVVLAPGLSCRQQIEDYTEVTPRHPVEYLTGLIDNANRPEPSVQ